MGEWVPPSAAELDRIEDALEGLESTDSVEDASAVVRDRLHSYREILVAARALPMRDAPEDLLHRVLQEARASTSQPVAVSKESATKQQGLMMRGWRRLRRTMLLPGLALVGTAALVLLIARPMDEEAPAEPRVAEHDQVKGAFKTRTGVQPSAVDAPLEAVVPGGAADAAEKSAIPESVVEDKKSRTQFQSAPKPAVQPQRRKAEAKKSDRGAGPAASENAIAGDRVVADMDEEEGTKHAAALSRADRARRQGDCASARKLYGSALRDKDRQVQARGHAGLGLCEAAAGKADSANKRYRAAKALDPAVAEFIEQELPQGGTGAGNKRSAKKGKSRKSAPARPAK